MVKEGRSAEREGRRKVNPFLVYRHLLKDFISLKYETRQSCEISRIAGAAWKVETPEVKKQFQDLALDVQRKRSDAKRNQSKRSAGTIEEAAEPSSESASSLQLAAASELQLASAFKSNHDEQDIAKWLA